MKTIGPFLKDRIQKFTPNMYMQRQATPLSGHIGDMSLLTMEGIPPKCKITPCTLPGCVILYVGSVAFGVDPDFEHEKRIDCERVTGNPYSTIKNANTRCFVDTRNSEDLPLVIEPYGEKWVESFQIDDGTQNIWTTLCSEMRKTKTSSEATNLMVGIMSMGLMGFLGIDNYGTRFDDIIKNTQATEQVSGSDGDRIMKGLGRCSRCSSETDNRVLVFEVKGRIQWFPNRGEAEAQKNRLEQSNHPGLVVLSNKDQWIGNYKYRAHAVEGKTNVFTEWILLDTVAYEMDTKKWIHVRFEKVQ